MVNDPRIDVLVDRTDRILKLLDGDHGLVERVTRLEVEVKTVTSNLGELAEEINDRAPTKKEKRGMWVGAGTGMAAFIGYLLTDLLPKMKG